AEVHPATGRRPEWPRLPGLVRVDAVVRHEQHRRRVGLVVEHERADAHAHAPAIGRGHVGIGRGIGHQSVSTFAEARRTFRTDAGGRGESSVPCAFACSTAAPTNATKSGCGRGTVDLYSGWNCTPTNHGWSAISMISTSPLSGLTPVNRSPAAVSSSRNALLTS